MNKTVLGIVTTMGVEIKGKSVVLCNGTFLNGIIHLGKKNYKGGRAGEPAAEGITKQLNASQRQVLTIRVWNDENLVGITTAVVR